MQRRKVKKIQCKDLVFGSDKIYIQSMLNVPSEDIEENVRQAMELEEAGCEIVRVSIPDKAAIQLIPAIKDAIRIPLVADIHFQHTLALESIAAGIDKVRINPGNIGSDDAVKAVAIAAKNANVPIRIGVNSGSLEKEILRKYGYPTPQALVESALYHVTLLHKFDFDDIVLSIKSSNVQVMVEAYELLAEQCEYPLHLGVTEAGSERMGIVKSAIGIGSLLLKGIGDTVRVSLTSHPVREIEAAKDILKAAGIDRSTPEIISCPTCGRTKIDLISLVEQVEEHLKNVQKPIKVAVMGCVVNGPGEAREADVGIAAGDKSAVLFKKGQIVRKIRENEILQVLMEEIDKL